MKIKHLFSLLILVFCMLGGALMLYAIHLFFALMDKVDNVTTKPGLCLLCGLLGLICFDIARYLRKLQKQRR